ncbi:hypothetical protein BDD12DRAFT_849740 [Trichophaea hybrida]|nr:hypothetical protein BDD12DRAFT_849740 [Trichophaea hybrida]
MLKLTSASNQNYDSPFNFQHTRLTFPRYRLLFYILAREYKLNSLCASLTSLFVYIDPSVCPFSEFSSIIIMAPQLSFRSRHPSAVAPVKSIHEPTPGLIVLQSNIPSLQQKVATTALVLCFLLASLYVIWAPIELRVRWVSWALGRIGKY